MSDSDAKKDKLHQKLTKARLQLRTLLTGLSQEQWQEPVYGEGQDWTVRDMVAHLVDAEYGLTRQIERICQGSSGIPEDFDLAAWNKKAVARMADKSPQELLQTMAQNRVKLLEVLDSIEEADWQKSGRHPSMAILTVEQYFKTIASHEANHTWEIAQAVGFVDE
ncbi:MAG: maleylpyruvate isomerase family mycothiol-dependent enzyme [Anaerolineae bacterium]